MAAEAGITDPNDPRYPALFNAFLSGLTADERDAYTRQIWRDLAGARLLPAVLTSPNSAAWHDYGADLAVKAQ